MYLLIARLRLCQSAYTPRLSIKVLKKVFWIQRLYTFFKKDTVLPKSCVVFFKDLCILAHVRPTYQKLVELFLRLKDVFHCIREQCFGTFPTFSPFQGCVEMTYIRPYLHLLWRKYIVKHSFASIMIILVTCSNSLTCHFCMKHCALTTFIRGGNKHSFHNLNTPM